MQKEYYADQEFKDVNFTEKQLKTGEYDNCTFIGCTFTQSSLIDFIFLECTFKQCDLSLANLTNTTFRDVKFNGCKMMGLHFEACSDILFSVSFVDCNLQLSSFFQRKMKQTTFVNCQLNEVDFTETNLAASNFKECDFTAAVFEYTLLEKADFRTSYNFIIDPENNRIKGAKFDAQSLKGLLTKYNIIVD